MKRFLTLILPLLCVLATGAMAQDPSSTSTTKTSTKQTTKRGPVFRATKDQINQAQALLKTRVFIRVNKSGNLMMRLEGLRKYQQAEGLRVTGTLNKIISRR